VDRTTALDRISKAARTGYGVGRTVAGQAGRAALGVSKAAAAAGRDVLERRRARPSVPAPREPARAPSTPVPPPAAPSSETDAAVTSDVDATVAPPSPTPADVARVAARKPPPKAPATKATRKPAKKSVPGAKLPPRKPTTDTKDADKG